MLDIEVPSGRRTVLPHTKNNTEDFKRLDLTNAFSGLSFFRADTYFLQVIYKERKRRHRSDEDSGFVGFDAGLTFHGFFRNVENNPRRKVVFKRTVTLNNLAVETSNIAREVMFCNTESCGVFGVRVV
jgi:hypothetical protein